MKPQGQFWYLLAGLEAEDIVSCFAAIQELYIFFLQHIRAGNLIHGSATPWFDAEEGGVFFDGSPESHAFVSREIKLDALFCFGTDESDCAVGKILIEDGVMIKHGILEVQIRNILIFKAEHIVSELLAIAQRLEVAKMLSEDARYQDICDKTGASSATVSRVNRALHYGEDGYALVLERLKNESEDGSANRHE